MHTKQFLQSHHSGHSAVHAIWAGSSSRPAYKQAVHQCEAMLREEGERHVLLDLREVRTPDVEKFYLGCLLVCEISQARCAVLLRKEHITGVLARVGAEAGMELETSWREESALSWLFAPTQASLLQEVPDARPSLN